MKREFFEACSGNKYKSHITKESLMSNVTIRELRSGVEILQAFPVMRQLRSGLDENSYMELVMEAREKEGYRMYALYEDDEIAAVIGFQPMITLYYGRFIWVSDLVTDENKRSRGYGKKLLAYLHNWATGKNYGSIALSSGLQRKDAHRFYEEKMNFEKVSYVFRVSL
jgi:GNAT superfamily N-acetyltransferase